MPFPNTGGDSGGNNQMRQVGSQEPRRKRHVQSGSYTDLDAFDRKCEEVRDKARNLRKECEKVLEHKGLEVAEDDELAQALEREWPQELDKPAEPRVSYRFYRAMRHRRTTSAGIIRRRYEQAARGVDGGPHLDIIRLVDIVLKESQILCNDLLPVMDRGDDKSEMRVVEAMYEWVVSANKHVNALRYVLRHGREVQLPEGEISSVGSREARQAQSIFKVKYNVINGDIKKHIDFLQSQFGDQADTFYNDILIPALRFRLQVGRKVFPDNSNLSQVVHKAAQSLDNNFSSVLGDQLRRNLLFQNKMESVEAAMYNRERFRVYMEQLAPKGRQTPADGLQDLPISSEEAEFWDRYDPVEEEELLYTPALRRPSDAITADHGSLAGVTTDDAHPQYLHRDGDLLDGDLVVADGVQIDGADISEHAHTGLDGTEQIDGSNIKGETIGEGHISPEAPPVPQNLRVQEFKQRVVPPGVTTIDAVLAWEGSDNHSYEVEIADRNALRTTTED